MTVYCFAMILAASRKKAVCFSLKEDADAIYEAVQELFDELGGVTLELLIDNPKAFVIRNNPKSEVEIEAIAKKVSTSVPQIRRDFTSRFSNGASYLEMAGKKFDQPTFHARRIMELQDLYDDETLDRFIRMAINEGKLDIKSFKTLLGVPKLAIFRIETMPLILPPMDLQIEFINFCKQVDKSKVAIQSALKETQCLFDSLMQEYFG
ncbi:MAG: hypothetical protein K6E85_14365 [Lachnospiraceae bacterium]|nr:hypothetical protein [Lachnospiraceae bacterium]